MPKLKRERTSGTSSQKINKIRWYRGADIDVMHNNKSEYEYASRNKAIENT